MQQPLLSLVKINFVKCFCHAKISMKGLVTQTRDVPEEKKSGASPLLKFYYNLLVHINVIPLMWSYDLMITTAYTLPLRCIKLRSTVTALQKIIAWDISSSAHAVSGYQSSKGESWGYDFIICIFLISGSSMQTLYSISTDRSLQLVTRLDLHTELTFSLPRPPLGIHSPRGAAT